MSKRHGGLRSPRFVPSLLSLRYDADADNDKAIKVASVICVVRLRDGAAWRKWDRLCLAAGFQKDLLHVGRGTEKGLVWFEVWHVSDPAALLALEESVRMGLAAPIVRTEQAGSGASIYRGSGFGDDAIMQRKRNAVHKERVSQRIAFEATRELDAP